MEAKDLNKDSPAQDVFDFVVSHLRQQGKKSLLEGEACRCAYLAKDGSTCAVGCLILPEEYHESFERHGVSVLANLLKDVPGLPAVIPNRERLGGLLNAHRALLESLQSAHDCWEPDEWERAFRTRASQYRLTYTPPIPKEEG